MANRREARRRWRRQGRRGQVAAVATILGLLLVVTFIANFLATTLPNQMSVNELSHEVLVEDEIGELRAFLQAASSKAAVGAEVSQPVALGSPGDPPFGAPDSGSMAPENLSAGVTVSYSLQGPLSFRPPAGYPASTHIPTGCSSVVSPSTQLNCAGSSSYRYNLSANNAVFTVTTSASAFGAVNLSGNHSSIYFSDSGSGAVFFQILGSYDTAYLTGTGSGPTNLTILGNFDNFVINTTGSGAIHILVVGADDRFSMPSTTGSGPLTFTIFGTQDNLTVSKDTGSGNLYVYMDGFNPLDAYSLECPYANLSSTDNVLGVTRSGSGTFTETLNNSVGYYANGTGSSGWPIKYQNVRAFACPFVSTFGVSETFSSATLAGFYVRQLNDYSPVTEVAFDEGMVVLAQPGAYPIVIDPPEISYTNGFAQLWMPRFVGSFATQAGTGTSVVEFRLLSSSTQTFPSAGFTVTSGSDLTLTVRTPYAEAWMSYLTGPSGLAAFSSCSGPTAACTGPYHIGGPLGTVTVQLPVSGLAIEAPLFAANVV